MHHGRKHEWTEGTSFDLAICFLSGRSSRTNDLGITSLRSLLDFFGYELRVIDIPEHALHPTSISSTPTDDLILASKATSRPTTLAIYRKAAKSCGMPGEEVYGCNTIGLPNGKVLVAEGYPAVKAALQARGLTRSRWT